MIDASYRYWCFIWLTVLIVGMSGCEPATRPGWWKFRGNVTNRANAQIDGAQGKPAQVIRAFSIQNARGCPVLWSDRQHQSWHDSEGTLSAGTSDTFFCDPCAVVLVRIARSESSGNAHIFAWLGELRLGKFSWGEFATSANLQQLRILSRRPNTNHLSHQGVSSRDGFDLFVRRQGLTQKFSPGRICAPCRVQALSVPRGGVPYETA
jgi:hypothetical protein